MLFSFRVTFERAHCIGISTRCHDVERQSTAAEDRQVEARKGRSRGGTAPSQAEWENSRPKMRPAREPHVRPRTGLAWAKAPAVFCARERALIGDSRFRGDRFGPTYGLPEQDRIDCQQAATNGGRQKRVFGRLGRPDHVADLRADRRGDPK